MLPLLAVTPDRIWPAFLVAAVQSALTRINNPAKVALLPQLVGHDQLIAANAANAASESLSRLVGSPLGGIVVELFGLGGVVLADGISFVVVAGATWLVRTDTSRVSRTRRRDATGGRDATRADGAGSTLGMIRRTPALARSCRPPTITSVAQGMFVVLYLAFVVRSLGGGGGEIGLIRGVQAIGGVLGSVAIARIAARVSGPTLFGGGLIGMGVMSFITWNAPRLSTATALYIVLFVVVGVPAVAGSVGWVDDRAAVDAGESSRTSGRHARRGQRRPGWQSDRWRPECSSTGCRWAPCSTSRPRSTCRRACSRPSR